VIIPVKNGGAVLRKSLAAVNAQKTAFPFEVLCIDSGSTDDSVEVIEAAGARLYQIPPHEFGHGKTRNLGVSLSQTPFVALITQDAIPADEHWLEALIEPFLYDDSVAGVFGPHLPHEGCRPAEAYLLERHFAQFGSENVTHRIGSSPRTWNEYASRRDFYCFFSDNNAALRRSVWERVPYRDVEFMEDQLWAAAVLEAGYGKAYAPRARVRHSHNYDTVTTLRRAFDESRFRRLYQDPPNSWSLAKWLEHGGLMASRDSGRLFHDLGRVKALPEVLGGHLRHRADSVGRFLGDNTPFLPRPLISWLSQHNSLKGSPDMVDSGSNIVEDVRRYVKATLAAKGIIDGWAELLHQAVHVKRASERTRAAEVLMGWRRQLRRAPSIEGWWNAGHYHFMAKEPKPLLGDRAEIQSESLVLNWIVPPFGEGGGGHLNIFRMIHLLEKKGITSRVYVLDGAAAMPFSNAQLRGFVHEWFAPVEASVEPLRDQLLPADFSIATHWSTAYAVKALGNARHLAYFVQDYEPLFYAASAEGVFAEATYKMGFLGIAAGAWLDTLLREKYGMKTCAFPLAVDHDTYWPESNPATGPQTVFAYVRPHTPRRAFELVSLALREVKRLRPAVEIHTAGSRPVPGQLPFASVNHGILNANQLRSLYSRMTVGVCASLSNYSLLPQEMAACGCPVVDLDGENTRAVYPPGSVVLAEPSVEGLSKEILKLLDDPVHRRAQVRRSLEYANSLTWDGAADAVSTALNAWSRAPAAKKMVRRGAKDRQAGGGS
jgi:glycosyltransferase involved in cell wall biosynthesis